MPMFYTPKPRQFRYIPRFYDPEKERWEALKQKYADEHRMKSDQCSVTSDQCADAATATAPLTTGHWPLATDDKDLEYFQRRVRELDREKSSKLTWKDLFRKREMPTFNYQPRFQQTDTAAESTGEHLAEFKKRGIKIKRRFDVSDTDYMKPIPAGRIMLYALLVCLLLYWILF